MRADVSVCPVRPENVMDSAVSDMLRVGTPVILIGVLVLGMMVRTDLGSRLGLGTGGRWMLTLALGTGVLAFGLKLGVALLIGTAPAHTVDRLIARDAVRTEHPDKDERWIFPPAQGRPARYVWTGLPERAPEPADNPSNRAKIELGRRLFYDKQLSADGTVSCNSCHDLYEKAGGDARPTSLGVAGQVGERNAPTLWNVGFQALLFWDGRAPSLEVQAEGPILNPREMGASSPRQVEQRLAADPSYRSLFSEAFADRQPIRFERVKQALAAYERTLIAADTPYDRFVQGDRDALNSAQLRGMALFESVGCVLCHRGPNFSDASMLGGGNALRIFPANATPYEKKYRLLTQTGARGVWRVPSLRNVALTGPWLHNGSVGRLEEVVRIMASAQLGRSAGMTAWLNPDRSLGAIDRTPLNDGEVRDIVAFLESLTSDSLRAQRRW